MLIATNGRVLAYTSIDATGENQLIHRDLLAKAAKPCKKSDTKIATSTPENVEIVVSDRLGVPTTQTLSQNKTHETHFPTWQQVIPQQVKPTRIRLSGTYLKAIAEYAIKHGDDSAGITISITDDASPAVLDVRQSYNSGKKSTETHFILMPIRMT